MANKVDYSTEIKNRALESVNEISDEAYAQMKAKEAAYRAKMQVDAKIQAQLLAAKSDYQRKQNLYQSTGQDNGFIEAKNLYSSLTSQASDSEISVSVLRDSLQSSISYSAKMNTSAFITNSVFS